MRFAVDTGGTFTDLVVEDDAGEVRMYKASTTPTDPVAGVLDTLGLAASACGMSTRDFLRKGEMLIHGTTHAINAIITGNTARTAFLTTIGHPDILVLREGGRTDPFNFTIPYPQPYIPRSLTYEVPERIHYDGSVRDKLDENAVIKIIGALKDAKVEAVAVCLLWSIVNPQHEKRVGELLEEHFPAIPYTLSHALNPSLREYRRASSAAIDASLKPLMGKYMGGLDARLREAGFNGRVLVVTTQGGAMDAVDIAKAPIHSINSGPAMAPLAGRFYAQADSGADTAIIADTGGTTFDVSLVRGSRIPWTRETWIGEPYRGHMTGFPAVDVKSIGAGGGSIAWVDEGGLLHIGPQSAGAVPGPVCYGKGGTQPTVTDASVVLGWIDPSFFLGGAMGLDKDAAARAIEEHVGKKLGFNLHEAAAAIISVATENMVHAIEDITVNQGIDPRGAVLIGGGGAAGLNVTAIARRLGCQSAIIPDVAAALSAAGALMSDLRAEFSGTFYTQTANFDMPRVNALLGQLESQCKDFAEGPGAGSISQTIEFTAEARYPSQIWEIEVPLRRNRISSTDEISELRDDFHSTHESIFAIADTDSEVELVGWRANVRCQLHDGVQWDVIESVTENKTPESRQAYFEGTGLVATKIIRFEDMAQEMVILGPAIIESSFTTVVVDPGASARRSESGSLLINPAI